MGYRHGEFDHLALDDFEDLFADKPPGERWELIGGRLVIVPAGTRWEHAAIVRNIALVLGDRFAVPGCPFQIFTETFYLKSGPLDSAMLPDVMVVSGDLEPGATAIDNPVVLAEVYSPGTEARDRFEKWHVYQQLASLQHYVLVKRDRPHLEVFDRVDGQWTGFRVLDGLDAVLGLPAVGAALPLSDIYRRVLAV